jgi:hypothetical protein
MLLKKLVIGLVGLGLSLVPLVAEGRTTSGTYQELPGRTNDGEKMYYGWVDDPFNGITPFYYAVGNKGNVRYRKGFLSCDHKVWIVYDRAGNGTFIQADSAASIVLVWRACQEAEARAHNSGV